MSNHSKSDGHPISIDVVKSAIVRSLNEDNPNNQSWKEYTVERDGDVPLAFEGLLLGKGETAVTAFQKLVDGIGGMRKRGYDAKIYKSKSGKYVVGFTAWSDLVSELDRYKAVIAETPVELYDGLMGLTGKGIPDAALLALREAAVADPALREIAVERI